MTAVPCNIRLRPADETIAHVHGEDNALYFVGITSSTALGSIEYTVTMISDYSISEFRKCQSATPGARELVVYGNWADRGQAGSFQVAKAIVHNIAGIIMARPTRRATDGAGTA